MGICGIYKLEFIGTTCVYIGQSVDIHRRYQEHIRSFELASASHKLKEAYDTYGAPSLHILVTCSETELDTLETEAIDIFDSVKNGFNTLSSANEMPKPDNSGTKHGLSKYSKVQILKVFELLANSDLEYSSISYKTGVNYSTVANISAGNAHTWLSSAYPDQYASMLAKKYNRNNGKEVNTLVLQQKILPVVISPEGVEYIVTNATKFARDHLIPKSTFRNILIGRSLNSRSGWRLKV